MKVLSPLCLAALVAPSIATAAPRSLRRGSGGCTDDPGSNDGPYSVGFRTGGSVAPIINFSRKGDPADAIPFNVWYPSSPDGTEGPAVVTLLDGTFQYPMGALADPPVASGRTCYPLVVFSHGSGGQSIDHNYLMKKLASYGHVVVAPTHLGTASSDLLEVVLAGGSRFGPEDIQNGTYNRPRDVEAVIDAALADSALSGSICADKIAVIGHSWGGFTALATANGHTHPLSSSDASYDAYIADDRVKAVVAMAPSIADRLLADPTTGKFFDLEPSAVPTLVLSAENDIRTPIAVNTEPLWDTIKCTKDKATYRVDLRGAGHNTFMDLCYFFDTIAQQVAGILSAALGTTITPAEIPATCGLVGDVPDLLTLCFIHDYVFAETLQAGCVVTDPLPPGSLVTLPIEEGQSVTATYVIAFLESTLGNGCYNRVLKKNYPKRQNPPLPFLDSTVLDGDKRKKACKVKRGSKGKKVSKAKTGSKGKKVSKAKRVSKSKKASKAKRGSKGKKVSKVKKGSKGKKG